MARKNTLDCLAVQMGVPLFTVTPTDGLTTGPWVCLHLHNLWFMPAPLRPLDLECVSFLDKVRNVCPNPKDKSETWII